MTGHLSTALPADDNMTTHSTSTAPQPALQAPAASTEIPLKEMLLSSAAAEYDPCAAAKPCSPFYLYRHDALRPSCEQKGGKPSVEVMVTDLELGSSINTPHLTPTVSEEKLDPQPSPKRKWQLPLFRRCQDRHCLTQPKPQGWLKAMPKRQRLMVKLALALVIAGCMVGIAVGIAVGLKSTVYQSANSQRQIGS